MSESVEPTDGSAEAKGTAPAGSVKVVTGSPRQKGFPWKGVGVVIGLLTIGALVFSQLRMISALEDTEAQLAETRTQIVALDSRLAGVSLSVDELADSVDSMATAQASGTGSTPAPAVETGYLPQYVQGATDTAIGLPLGPITGTDAYTADTVTIDPADGTKRVWMVWAHWCPYCQEELPTLKTFYDTFDTDYPGVELATVTTSIDPARGNPLDEYLAAEQFDFPVVVDADGAVSGQMGVNAFPFWVVTDADGTVLLRVAGYMDADRLDSLLTSVAEWEA